MTDVLAAIGGGGTLIGLVAVIVLAFKLVGAKDEQLAARDLYGKLDEQFDALEVDRNGLKVELDSERAKTKGLTNRVAVVEAERNEAFRIARDHVVERIKQAKIADANRLVAELLALSPDALRGMPQAVPRSAEPTSGDGLMDPSEL